MTTISQAAESIYDRFISNWDEDDAAYTFEGENFTAPTGDPWIRVTIRDTGGGQETLGEPGNRKYERQSSVIFQIFTPTNQGIAAADSLVEALRVLFEGVTFNGLRFFDSDVRQQGVDGLWYMVVVESKFTYNETK